MSSVSGVGGGNDSTALPGSMSINTTMKQSIQPSNL